MRFFVAVVAVSALISGPATADEQNPVAEAAPAPVAPGEPEPVKPEPVKPAKPKADPAKELLPSIELLERATEERLLWLGYRNIALSTACVGGVFTTGAFAASAGGTLEPPQAVTASVGGLALLGGIIGVTVVNLGEEGRAAELDRAQEQLRSRVKELRMNF